MKMSFLIVLGIGVLSCTGGKMRPNKAQMGIEVEEKVNFLVNGEPVAKSEYESFIAGLSAEQEGWSCAEHADGGTVSYLLRDKAGKRYRVKEQSSSKGRINSVTAD